MKNTWRAILIISTITLLTVYYYSDIQNYEQIHQIKKHSQKGELKIINNENNIQILYKSKCSIIQPEQYSILQKFLENSQIPFIKLNSNSHKTQNCEQLDLTHKSNLLNDYRYGNWCGRDYGGFESNCKEICLQNMTEPSAECIQCDQPKDYVDRACMYHDFCQTNFTKFGIGSNSCEGTFSIGDLYPTPCSCSILLRNKLSTENILSYCDSMACIFNGGLIRAGVDNPLMKCGCEFQGCEVAAGQPNCTTKQLCLTTNECIQINGE